MTTKNTPVIYIPEQFERPSEHGYLKRHMELTQKLEGLLEPYERDNEINLEGRHYSILFHQACEDVARNILLNEDAITSIQVSDVQLLVEERYTEYMENPEMVSYSPNVTIH